MTKISVIIPVFNAETFLKKTIESVLNQTLKDIEIICVDDGSTDNSLDVLNELKGSYNSLKVYSQKNQGPAVARNLGVKNATGEFLSFLDADDIFVDENALEEMYDFAIKNELNVVSANFIFISPDYTLHDNPHYEAGDYSYFDDYGIIHPKDYGIPYGFTKTIFNKGFLEVNNIDFPIIRAGEDPIFLAKVFANTLEIGVVPLTLYGYNHTIGGGVNMKINDYEKKKEYIQHFKDVCDILSGAGLHDTSDFYKIHMFRFLTWAENNHDSELFEIFNDVWGINNTSFDETDFNYTRFIIPAKVYFINKFDSEEFFIEVNKDFLQINIYDTNAIDEKVIDDYFLVSYAYSFDDFKLNYSKFLKNNLKFKKEFMEYKVNKFIFNLKINPTPVVMKNTKLVISKNPVWKGDLFSKDTLKTCLNLIM